MQLQMLTPLRCWRKILVVCRRLYAERLRRAGVDATLYDAPGLVHGCIRARALSPAVDTALSELSRFLRERLVSHA